MKRFVWRKILVSAAVLSASLVLVGSSVGFVREVSPQAAPLAEPLSLRIITIQTGNTIQVNCVGTLALSGHLLSCVALTPTPTEVATDTPTATSTPTAAISSSPSASPTASLSPSSTPTSTSSNTSTATPTGTSGLTYYVSPSGNGTDGKSWETAWKELNTIGWGSVQPGDRIELDGGSTRCNGPYNASTTPPYDFASKPTTCGMVYRTTLTLGKDGTSALPIIVELASDVGHDGTAVFFGGRSVSLPSCNQATYTPQGSLVSGIVLNGRHNVIIDGKRRSGIIQYGAQQGVQTSGGGITLRNLEMFDNGVATHGSGSPSSFGSPAAGSFGGWWSDGWNVWWGGGSNINFERVLFHDAGQDILQGASTASNITISSSWWFNSRENPLYPGYGFNTGPNQLCTHSDHFQLWGPSNGVSSGLTIKDTILSGYVNQSLYPTDTSSPQYNNVTLQNVLFLQERADAINTVSSAPSGWQMTNVTFYRFGNSLCCALDGDSWPNSSITNSINVGGDSYAPGLTGSGNIWFSGVSLPGSVQLNPLFVRPLTTGTPHWSDLLAVDLTTQAPGAAGKGSTLHRFQDILDVIDGLNGL